MSKLGTVKNRGFDSKGYERRSRLDALATCPKCGQEVECWAETEAWTQGEDGRWLHSEYGGACGMCETCQLLIADCLSDGYQVFDMGADRP